MNTLDQQIGIRLKIARCAFGWKTAARFCEAEKIKKSTYSQHEKGNRSLTAELLIKYARVFDVELSWLLTGYGHPCPKSKDGTTRKALIEAEVKKYQIKLELPQNEVLPVNINDRYAVVNIELFAKILELVTISLNSKKNSYKFNGLTLICLNIYNHIEPLNLSETEKEKLLNLCIDSMSKVSELA